MGVDLYAITNKELNKIQWKTYDDCFSCFMGRYGDDVLSYIDDNGRCDDVNTFLEDMKFPRIPCRYVDCEYSDPLYMVCDKAYDIKIKNGENVDYFKFKRKLEEASAKASYCSEMFMHERKSNYRIGEYIPFSGCKGVDVYTISHYTRVEDNREECTRLYKIWTPELFKKLADIDCNLCLHAIELYNLYVDGYFFYWSI